MIGRLRSRRGAFALAAILVIGVGLTTRLPDFGWPPVIAKYLGSLLWGAMVFCVVGFIRPRWRIGRLALVAACIAVTVEISQLWHTPWLDSFRQTRLGVLLIGRFFAWTDIVAYVAGIIVAAGIDGFLSWLGDRARLRPYAYSGGGSGGNGAG
jgi:hypothetical protein